MSFEKKNSTLTCLHTPSQLWTTCPPEPPPSRWTCSPYTSQKEHHLFEMGRCSCSEHLQSQIPKIPTNSAKHRQITTTPKEFWQNKLWTNCGRSVPKRILWLVVIDFLVFLCFSVFVLFFVFTGCSEIESSFFVVGLKFVVGERNSLCPNTTPSPLS